MRFPTGSDLNILMHKGGAMSGVSRCTTVVSIGLSLVLLCAAGTSSATAQGVSLGFKGGLNLSTLSSNEDPEDVKTRTGFHVGGFSQYNLLAPSLFSLGPRTSRKERTSKQECQT